MGAVAVLSLYLGAGPSRWDGTQFKKRGDDMMCDICKPARYADIAYSNGAYGVYF